MSYEFQSTLYRCPTELADGIASEWLSAGGANRRADMLEILSAQSDERLADECIQMWRLDQTSKEDFSALGEDAPKTWMESREIDRDMLVEAFADIRKYFDQRYPEAPAD